MPISILHVGLPFDHPVVPPEDRERIAKRTAALQQSMREAGYHYDILHIAPDNGIQILEAHLKEHPIDAVLIGGGVTGTEDLSFFMEQIIDTTHRVVPPAKILFFKHSVPVRTIVERWFPPQSKDSQLVIPTGA